MASIIKRKRNNRTTYLAFVRREGVKAIAKSFYNKTDAKKWARAMEHKLDTGDFSDYSEASKLTLGDLFERYIEEVKHSTKKDKKNHDLLVTWQYYLVGRINLHYYVVFPLKFIMWYSFKSFCWQ